MRISIPKYANFSQTKQTTGCGQQWMRKLLLKKLDSPVTIGSYMGMSGLLNSVDHEVEVQMKLCFVRAHGHPCNAPSVSPPYIADHPQPTTASRCSIYVNSAVETHHQLYCCACSLLLFIGAALMYLKAVMRYYQIRRHTIPGCLVLSKEIT